MHPKMSQHLERTKAFIRSGVFVNDWDYWILPSLPPAFPVLPDVLGLQYLCIEVLRWSFEVLRISENVQTLHLSLLAHTGWKQHCGCLWTLQLTLSRTQNLKSDVGFVAAFERIKRSRPCSQSARLPEQMPDGQSAAPLAEHWSAQLVPEPHWTFSFLWFLWQQFTFLVRFERVRVRSKNSRLLTSTSPEDKTYCFRPFYVYNNVDKMASKQK